MNGNPRWDGNNPSDTALRALVRSADSKVVISQQNLIFDCARDPSYDVRLLDAIAEQVRDGVKVTIVVSNKDAVIKALEEDYGGGADSSRAVVMKRLTKLMGSSSLAKEAACRSLTVAPFRFSSLTTWPGSNAPGLHSKVIAVDDQAVMVGSQNAYPNQLQEFGYLIEDSRAMADMKRLFLDPIESNARAAALPCG
jgi:phosphatidylserine/phosphatidylglycerophosphate/cardiolipin synthase-like enzyme